MQIVCLIFSLQAVEELGKNKEGLSTKEIELHLFPTSSNCKASGGAWALRKLKCISVYFPLRAIARPKLNALTKFKAIHDPCLPSLDTAPAYRSRKDSFFCN